MPQFVKHFVQDLTQDIKIRQCGTIVFNGDNLSNVITIDLYNGTEPYSGGGSVSCSVICPDGATVPITNGSISGNTVTVTLTGDCFAIPGQIGVGVQVVSDDIRTTVLKAIYNVELLETDTIVDPGSRITASVGQLVSDIEAATAEIPASDMASLMAGIAPTFSASINYNAGAYVYYNGTLYRFTADHAAGSWTGTDATAVALGNDLGGQVSDLKSALSKTENTIGSFEKPLIEMNFPQSANTDILSVTDAEGNVGISLDYKGDFHAPTFDSAKTPVLDMLKSTMAYDFAVQDEEGNIAFAILNGLAMTNQRLYGKNLAIVGDSISTYQGYIPSGYEYFYPYGDVDSVEKTWWKKLVNEFGLNLIRNASWSGSYVSGNSHGTAVCACSDARINALVGDNNETPDIIITYIGTNDWAHDVALGSFDSRSSIPSEGTISEISKAYALMLHKIRTTYPKAVVYCVLQLEGRLLEYNPPTDTEYPIQNSNGVTIHEVNHAIEEIAHIFGCETIDLETSGIHFWNINDYTVTGENKHVHPNAAGAEIIKEVVKQKLINTYHNI